VLHENMPPRGALKSHEKKIGSLGRDGKLSSAVGRPCPQGGETPPKKTAAERLGLAATPNCVRAKQANREGYKEENDCRSEKHGLGLPRTTKNDKKRGQGQGRGT